MDTETTTYGVQVGDDGRWHARYPSLDEARHHALRLSSEGTLRRAQIVNFTDGTREGWKDGERA